MTATRSLKEKLVALACDISNRLRNVPEIEVPELQQLNSSDTVIVDTRTDTERFVSVIPGAISAERFEQDRQLFASKRVIVYCTAGYRSGLYVKKLAKTDPKILASSLRGGILAWCQSGQPLEAPDRKPTCRVHVHSRQWNLVPENYEAVW